MHFHWYLRAQIDNYWATVRYLMKHLDLSAISRLCTDAEWCHHRQPHRCSTRKCFLFLFYRSIIIIITAGVTDGQSDGRRAVAALIELWSNPVHGCTWHTSNWGKIALRSTCGMDQRASIGEDVSIFLTRWESDFLQGLFQVPPVRRGGCYMVWSVNLFKCEPK